MTPESFIRKWSANTRPERASSVEHFNDLCRLLDEPTPNEADPDGVDYAFEKGVTKSAIEGLPRRGFADVWRRGRFALEYKKKGADLNAAFVQLQRYALALDNPPLLVVSDIDVIVIRTAWTNTVSETITVRLVDLADPARLRTLKHMMSDPDRLKPRKTRQKLTEQAAGEFVIIARRLQDRGFDPLAVAHFVNRLVFCLFADHAGLLEDNLWSKFLLLASRQPSRFEEFASRLFGALSKAGSEWDMTSIPWFNGGLFNDDAALPLRPEDIARLQAVRTLDWADIDVSIFGTLFERALDPGKRSQLGAHYTDRDKIMLIIDPVIVRPLRAEWAQARAGIEAALARGAAVRGPVAVRARAQEAAREEAQALYRAFHDRLAAFRVLDPACGSGNFLFLAVQALQDIEHLAGIEAEAFGLQRLAAKVGPDAVLGIDVNPFAAELARVSVWIGHLQWLRRNLMPIRLHPLLRPLDTIECRDAVLEPDGSRAAWPAADVIVGNPPFLGDKMMRGMLGDAETERLRAAYAGRVPGGADLVCYWFEAARDAVASGRVRRAGLVATNSIRGGANRHVLDAIARDAVIFEAWSDEPWTVDGAAVRVSLVCFAAGADEVRLDGVDVPRITADLATKPNDLTDVRRLSENMNICFQGTLKVGPFDVDGNTARAWLLEPPNADGRSNSDVVKPWRNAMHVMRHFNDAWIVDFGPSMNERQAAFYAKPYAHVVTYVKPLRMKNRDPQRRRDWWRLGRSHSDLRTAIASHSRYVVTPRVSKHRVFVWFEKVVVPDTRLCVIARDDEAHFGLLHSRFHESWSLRLASWHGVGNDPTYNTHSCYETFPFPDGLTPNIAAAAYADDPRARAIAAAAAALVDARDRWLNPGELALRVPDVLPHLPHRVVPRDAAAAVKLKSRTLTNLYNTRGTPEGAWLDALHADLDAAVAAAYGWPADITEADALAALLALNVERAGAG